MEKTMSVEEKIRRAEEIYNRRNGNSYLYETRKKEMKKPSLVKKMIKQIVICFIIYGIFYVTANREYFFTDEFQIKFQEILSQNETLNQTYTNIVKYLEENLNINIPQNINTNTQEQKQSENATDTQNQEQLESITTKEDNSQQNLVNNDENIGGAEECLEQGKIEEENTQYEKTQEEKDVEEIKNTINFILPINGNISSTFGWRTPTTATVPKYHTGLDIAAKTGTVIKSATDGKVILASSEGDYGKHYKIQINDIIIIYAHCSKLYLKEGDTVTQGQEIAEVGSTGNSTRTTSTF